MAKINSSKYVLAIPCYNCEKQIERVIEKLVKSKICRKNIEKIIVFDNQSQDRTQEIILNSINKHQIRNWMSCLINEKNYGLGGTQKLAFNYAFEKKYKSLIILHGDDQACVEDLEAMLAIHNEDASISILGARFMKESKLSNYSLIRILGNRMLNILYSVFCRRRVFDLGSGLNIYSVSTKLVKNLDSFSDGFSFNMDILLFMFKENLPLKYFPIAWNELDQVSNAKNIKVGLLALRTLLKWKYLKPKIQTQCHQYRFSEIN